MTLLSTTTLSGSSTTISSISQDYLNLYIIVTGVTTASGGLFRAKINNVSGVTNFVQQAQAAQGNSTNYMYVNTDLYFGHTTGPTTSDAENTYILEIFDYTSSTKDKLFTGFYGYETSGETGTLDGVYRENTAVSSINFFNGLLLSDFSI